MARYALIIGIAEYTGHFPSLETPVQNANAIADILDQYGHFNQVRRLPFRREAGQKDLGKVIRKPLPNATLVRELQQFLQDANGSDVLLYYSGHGFTKVQPLSGTLEGYLAPSDCQVDLNAAGQIMTEKNGISLSDLNELINRHQFSSLVVVLDCCNAGAFLESGMVRRDVTAFGYQRDYYLITACRSDSKAYEGKEYSLLTAAVLKGLAPANASSGSGRISGDRLFDVVGDELQNSRQEPLRMGWGRSITLVRYEQQQATPTLEATFNPANPYMGLKAFEQHQADYFFGREQSVRALLDRLAENRFLAVIGPSGCGKSSLVKAGLLPELESDRIPGSHTWQVEIITPGQYPLQTLANALERHHPDDKPVVLFVDQFEELFTLCPHEEEQRTFIKRLNEETNDPTKQTRIIVAMRGDFLDRCAKFQEAADLINSTAPTTYMVIPLTEAKLVGDLEDSITCPATLHGVSFEQGLVSRIVDDVVNQPGAMPLLQYALLHLWENCISPNGVSRLLTIQSYEAIDGVKGALQRWADQFYTNLSSTDQTFVRELISELVQIGDGGEVTRRRASWERLHTIASQEQLDRIIGRLVYQRLLVADEQTVEVAHEALLSESKLIQGWIEENRDSIRLQQRLEIYCREWQDHDRSENYLLDAGRLAAIDEWMEKKQPRLMPVDQEFIDQSRERRDRQFQVQLDQERRLREEAEGRELAEIEKKIEAEARAEAEGAKVKESEARIKAERQKTRIAITAGVLASFSLGLITFIQYQQKKVGEQEARTVEALIGKAEQLFTTHNELEALVASINALSKLKEMNRQDQVELKRIQSVIIQIREKNRLKGHQSGVYALSFSPDGKTLASGGFDGRIRLWDLEGNRTFPIIQAHGDAITAVQFSSNGKLIVSSSVDKTAKVWDEQGVLVRAFSYTSSISDVDFSSDNKTIAASSNNNIILWNISSGSLISILTDVSLDTKNKQSIRSLSFNPTQNSMLISTGSNNYDFAIWDLGKWNQLKHKEPRRIGRATSTAWSAKFSLDGRMIVSSQRKGVVKLWNSNSGLIGEIKDDNNLIIYAEFSPDNKFIVTVGATPGVKTWSVTTALEEWRKGRNILKVPVEEYKLNASSVYRARFSPSYSKNNPSRILATGGDNGIISVWSFFEKKPKGGNLIKLDELLGKGCSMLDSYSDRKLLKEQLRDCIQ